MTNVRLCVYFSSGYIVAAIIAGHIQFKQSSAPCCRYMTVVVHSNVNKVITRVSYDVARKLTSDVNIRGYSRNFLGPVTGPKNLKNLVFGRKILSF